MSRPERLDARFKLIQETMTELYGKDLAFAGATAAWLMALQHMALSSMKAVQRFNLDGVGQAAAVEEMEKLDAIHEATFRGFHKQICEHLGVDPVRALELSKAFEQVVRDICFQGG